MKKQLISLLAISMIFITACTKAPEKTAEVVDTSKVIITINDGNITKKEFDNLMDKQLKMSFHGKKELNLQDPQNKFMYLLFKDRAVNELIIRELLEQEVNNKNIQVSNRDVNKAVDEIAKKMGGKDKFEQALKANNLSIDELKNNIKEDLKVKKLVDNLAVTRVSDKDVEKFYEENKNSKFKTPNQVKAQHILISASEDEIKSKIEQDSPTLTEGQIQQKVDNEMIRLKAKTKDILQEAKKEPYNFDKLAMKYSEDFSSAKNGGDLGFFTKEQMVPEFSKAAFALKTDEISDIVKTTFGYHIIKVTDRKNAGVTPLSEVKDEIKQYLNDQNKVLVLQSYLEKLKNNAEIKYVDESYKPEKIQEELKEFAKQHKQQKK